MIQNLAPPTFKAELKFTYDPNNPEDAESIKRVVNQLEYKYECIVDEVLGKIRSYLKHGHNFKDADEALEHIQQFIYEEKS